MWGAQLQNIRMRTMKKWSQQIWTPPSNWPGWVSLHCLSSVWIYTDWFCNFGVLIQCSNAVMYWLMAYSAIGDQQRFHRLIVWGFTVAWKHHSHLYFFKRSIALLGWRLPVLTYNRSKIRIWSSSNSGQRNWQPWGLNLWQARVIVDGIASELVIWNVLKSPSNLSLPEKADIIVFI